MKSNEEIKQEIEQAFNKVQKNDKINNRRGWTKAFFDELKRIGLDSGFKVYSSSTSDKISEKEGGPEWLFDLSWSKEKPGKNSGWDKNYEGLNLICESEWSMDVEEIIYDFQKLAVGKAEIKLMIVQFDDINVFNELIKICKKSISNKLLNDGSFYYLVGSGNDSNTVEFIPLSINHNTVPKRE